MLEDIIDDDNYSDVVVGRGRLHIIQYSQYAYGIMDKPVFERAIFYVRKFEYEIIRFKTEYKRW